MGSFGISLASLGFMAVGSLIGIWFGRVLPEPHLSADSKDSVKQGLGLISTLTALVMGLLVASTKGTFDAQGAAVREIASAFMTLDRVLAKYGPEAKDARAKIPALAATVLRELWPDGGGAADLGAPAARAIGDGLFDQVAALDPKNDAQRLLKPRALETVVNLSQLRQRLVAQEESSIPRPFLYVLAFWLTVVFGCKGLMAPRNSTVFVVLVVCMLSVAGGLFLVLEMDRPFEGTVRVSNAALRAAIPRLGQ